MGFGTRRPARALPGKLRLAFAAYAAKALEPRVLLSTTRFAVIGDFSAGQPEKDVSDLVKSWNPAFVVTVGDNNYPDGAASTIDANIGQYYHQYITPYKGTYGAGPGDGQNHFWPALGNHDWVAANAQPYLDYFALPNNERYYDVQQGNIGLFVVDSDPHEPDGNTSTSTQGTWLKNELAASTAKWKLVFFHHPAYTSGISGGATSMRWPFAQWGATAVLAGHDHVYERLSENGFPYFTDGLGGESVDGFSKTDPGSQVRYAGDYGAMLVTADDTSITFQFYTRAGTLIDTYTVGSVTGPAAPTTLSATAASNSQINLAWADNSTNETGFKIERSTDNLHFTQVATVGANVTTYKDTGLSAGTPYYYRVRATNSAGDSAYTTTATATTQFGVTFIPAGDTWKYLDNGSDQGTAWRGPSFSDATWKTGRAQLGYGDGDETTIVGFGSNANNKFVTTYFRRTFSVSSPSSVTALNLNLIRDDGAVVYVNGTEVFRNNMATGTVGYRTLASQAVGGTDESAWYPAAVSKSLLVAGTNVVAVEIHQADVTSSDISFDFQLAASTAMAPSPPAAPSNLSAVALSPSQVTLNWADNSSDKSGFKIERSGDGVTFAQIALTSPNVVTYNDTTVAANTTYTYRVRATNTAGDSAYSNAAVAAPLTPPAAPTGLTASAVLGTQVQLNWADNSTNESGFKIDRSADGVNFTQIVVGEDNVPSYLDTTVAPTPPTPTACAPRTRPATRPTRTRPPPPRRPRPPRRPSPT